MRNHLASIGIAASVLVVTSIALLGQSQAPKPPADGVALGGYCPVAYVAMNEAVKGDPQHNSEYQGRTYHFANAEAKTMFDAAPAKYSPAYDGLCATGIAHGMKLQSDPKLFTVHNGRTYLFSNAEAKAMFDKDKNGIVTQADGKWPTLKQQ